MVAGNVLRIMVDKRETNEVNMPEDPKAAPPKVSQSANPPPRSTSLQIFYGENRQDRQPLLFDSERVVVGRGDEGYPVDMDFSSYDAHENGVSRYHAAFTRSDAGVFVEDTGSTNGTRINGFQLEPNRAYLLRNGDEIEFGRLRTVIRFKR